MDLVESYNSINESDLLLIEEQIGYQLPAEYKSFLLQHNGGRPVLDGVRYENQHLNF